MNEWMSDFMRWQLLTHLAALQLYCVIRTPLLTASEFDQWLGVAVSVEFTRLCTFGSGYWAHLAIKGSRRDFVSWIQRRAREKLLPKTIGCITVSLVSLLREKIFLFLAGPRETLKEPLGPKADRAEWISSDGLNWTGQYFILEPSDLMRSNRAMKVWEARKFRWKLV